MATDCGRSRRWALTHKILEELGLISLYSSTIDVKLLCIQRFVRLFAYGSSTIVLVAFLRELGISKTRIGIFMTLTLVGDVAISFLLALFADAVGRRAILVLGSLLMVTSGLVFASFDNYWILLAAAVFGVISPSGAEIGPFRAVEESTVAHLTNSNNRSDVYAWYSLSGNAGTAFGVITGGWIVHRLHQDLEWQLVDAYRVAFYGYTVLGFVKTMLAFMLSNAVELDKKNRPQLESSPSENRETAPLLHGEDAQIQSISSLKRSWFPKLSRGSIRIMISLCALFALDSFASGLVSLSWTVFYFKSRYDLDEGVLGSIFFVTTLIAAASIIVASSLAKRFGNVRTMVFTHLPSAIFLALIPVPSEVHLSIMFVVLRACTQSMDVAPRSAFLAAILLPQERTAVMGLVNVIKTTAQSLAPLITGLLADSNYFWVSFVCAGSLKACYDLGLLALFKNHERDREEQTSEEES